MYLFNYMFFMMITVGQCAEHELIIVVLGRDVVVLRGDAAELEGDVVNHRRRRIKELFQKRRNQLTDE